MKVERRFLLVDSGVLPQAFEKIVQAKELLAKGGAKSAAEAAKAVGISRSTFYRYRDCVFAAESYPEGSIITVYATLYDEPGVLAAFVEKFHRSGMNILTVNQNIPVDGVAYVSVSARSGPDSISRAQFMSEIKKARGVVEARIL